jgi:antitoxin ParD1/3/4
MAMHQLQFNERFERMIDALVSSGRFRSVGEVIEEGLRLVEDREARNAQKLATLREAITVADESVAAGDYVEFDSPEALEQYLRELTERVLRAPAK